MGIYVNPDNELFQRDLNGDIYVDKSMIIDRLNKKIDKPDNYLCVSRPRRFGKTMATNLMVAFYSKGCDSRDLFSKLKIAKTPDWDKNLNKFNVIKFDVQGIFSFIDDEENLPKEIGNRINSELIEAFPEAHVEIDDFLGEAMLKVYATTGEQFILIMDEYDVMVRNNVSQEAFDNYLKFLNGMFKNSEVRKSMHLAYLTGILPIVRDKIQSKLNEFIEYTILQPRDLGGFIGFTEEEVKGLCKKYDMDFSECKNWYNGYRLGDDLSIYNPRSVVEAMNLHKYGDYWAITGSYEVITDYLKYNFEGFRDDIITMISNKPVEVDISTYVNTLNSFKFKDDIFTFLIHLGYLSYNDEDETCSIPNREILKEWIKAIKYEESYSNIMSIVKDSKILLQETLAGNEDAVAKALESSHSIAANSKNYNNEGAFQAAICLAYIYAVEKYNIFQELTTGKGYADVVFVPLKPDYPAIIVELKYNDCVETALNQIKNKNYSQSLYNYKGNLLFVGINYNKKNKTHECKIERLEK